MIKGRLLRSAKELTLAYPTPATFKSRERQEIERGKDPGE